jgi:CDGSH-type Zn-finger protein
VYLRGRSGVVSYAHDSKGRRPAMTVKITCRPNGPYLVEGDVELSDPTGGRVDTSGRPRIALCRCGGSTTKPFCDGTHSKLGFQAAEAAVAQQQPKK